MGGRSGVQCPPLLETPQTHGETVFHLGTLLPVRHTTGQLGSQLDM